MKKMLATAFSLATLTLMAQEPLTATEELKKSRREQNFYFLQQTLDYSRLSYTCLPGFDRGSPKEWYVLSSVSLPRQ